MQCHKCLYCYKLLAKWYFPNAALIGAWCCIARIFIFIFSLWLAETLITLILKDRERCQTSVHFHNWSQSFCSQTSCVGTLKEEIFLIFNRLSCDSCSLPPQKFDGAESAERRHRGLIHMEILSSARDQQLKDVLCLRIPPPLSPLMRSCQNWQGLQQDLQRDIVI